MRFSLTFPAHRYLIVILCLTCIVSACGGGSGGTRPRSCRSSALAVAAPGHGLSAGDISVAAGHLHGTRQCRDLLPRRRQMPVSSTSPPTAPPPMIEPGGMPTLPGYCR